MKYTDLSKKNKKYIGFVKWYDPIKDFGFIVTNNIWDKTPYPDIVELYFNDNTLNCSRHNLKEGTWVTFERNATSQRKPALNIQVFDFSEQNLFCAMQYCGVYSRFYGKGHKDNEFYDMSIFEYIFEEFKKNIHDSSLLCKAICEHVARLGSKVQYAAIVEDFSLNKSTEQIFFALFFPVHEFSVINNSTYKDIQYSIINHHLKYNNIEIIEKIPSYYNISRHLNDIENIVSNNIVKINSVVVDLLLDKLFDLNSDITHKIIHKILNEYKNLSLEKIYHIIQRYTNDSFLYNMLSKKLNQHAKENEHDVSYFLTLFEGETSYISVEHIYNALDNIEDELNLIFFTKIFDVDCLNNIKNFQNVTVWLKNQSSSFLYLLLTTYIDSIGNIDEDDIFISQIPHATIRKAMENKTLSEQIQLLQSLPQSLAIDIVHPHYSMLKLHTLFFTEVWNFAKSTLSYVVFDIESDGSSIHEFAFRSEENTRCYIGEEQIKTLERIIVKKDVVVGHNIKEWDLKVLRKKGITTNSFIWDTLEIELLLNPCRYSYALLTTHNAKDDTELTDKLFWNQLYRLSQNPALCEQLKPILPAQFNEFLSILEKPYFKLFIQELIFKDVCFFYGLQNPNNAILEKLEAISKLPQGAPVLILAPKALWGTIALQLHVSFSLEENDIEYLPLSLEKLPIEITSDIFSHLLFQRFAAISKSSVLANIPQYIRENYLKNVSLLSLVEYTASTIECMDMNTLHTIGVSKKYQYIYVLGCEMNDRLQQYTLSQQLTASDFLAHSCYLPMRMSGTNYMYLPSEDRERLHIDGLPPDASNVWVEKENISHYKICYNFDLKEKIRSLQVQQTNACIFYTSWHPNITEFQQNITLAKTAKVENLQKRVSAISRYRASYWCYQVKMLRNIVEREDNLPIIYIIEQQIEVENVEKYFDNFGWRVGTGKTLNEKIKKLHRKNIQIIIIHKDDIENFLQIKQYSPYCFIWDQMAVDKCRMMWFGHIPFGDEAEPENSTLHEDTIEKRYITPKYSMLSAWGMYKYYFNIINEQCSDSKIYIMEPYFDDYPDLHETWNIQLFAADLWENDDAYNNDLNLAKNFFTNYPQETESVDIPVAMETMKKMFLGEEASWHPYQEEVLPNILKKDSHLLISIPTGGGKSVLFQGPVLYRSAFTNRLSLVITPLKALMEDQVQSLHDRGFYANVEYLSGDKATFETRQVYRRIQSGEIALLYITPERFRSRAFCNALAARMDMDGGLEYFIFDEAHCVSQWGQDFRPDYLNVMDECKKIVENYPQTCITLYSATVTKQVETQIKEYVPSIAKEGECKEHYNPIRDHISMQFTEVRHDDTARLEEVFTYIENNKKNLLLKKSRMLIFCRTKQQCEETQVQLKKHQTLTELGIGYFHAGMDFDEREDAYSDFKNGDVQVLCSTKAFGMGMDIPNVHYIMHYSPPSVLEDYLQEVGRAGRNKEQYLEMGFNNVNPIKTQCLYSLEDFKKAKDLIKKNSLTWLDVRDVMGKLIEYITKIQTTEETQGKPVVIPNNLWHKGDKYDDNTPFRLGLFWLQKLGRIRLGYLATAHINITLLPCDAAAAQSNFTTPHLEKNKKTYDYLKNIASSAIDSSIQISLSDMQQKLHMTSSRIMDTLIQCAKNRLLTIDQGTYCKLSARRMGEINHIFTHKEHIFTLAIIFSAAKKCLVESKNNEEYTYRKKDWQSMLENIFFEKPIKIITDVKYKKDEKPIETEYMPWYNVEDSAANKDVGYLKADSYKKDLFERKWKHVFTLLQLIPGIKHKTHNDEFKKEIIYTYSIVRSDCLEYLTSFEEHCFMLLRYVYERHEHNEKFLDWAKVICELNLDNKGFQYFSDILYVLKILNYVHTKSLLPQGIEVFTTNEMDTQILENPADTSKDGEIKTQFEEVALMRDIRLASMKSFSMIPPKEFGKLISAYFQSGSVHEYVNLLEKYDSEDKKLIEELQGIALRVEEEKLGDEQKIIYGAGVTQHINVIAGPGSGKTHILTLRCAKLIYGGCGVDPKNILVLAYNRAVITELKNRLSKLFSELGLSRSASNLHICNFHQLAKRVCGEELQGKDFKEWEKILLAVAKHSPNMVRKVLGDNIRHIMVDEFQDITQTRLDMLFQLKEIYPNVHFFTIGDPNQSIYGFDKKIEGIPEAIQPSYYYDQLQDKLHPLELTMGTNYRSYQKILDAASQFLSENSLLPKSATALMKNEPVSEYVHYVDNIENPKQTWFSEFEQIVAYAKEKKFQDIAIFFRSNDEVFKGYSWIKGRELQDVRIRIQGTDACELFRLREIFSIMNYIKHKGNILLRESSKKEIQEIIIKGIKHYSQWDTFYMDFAYTLVLEFFESIADDGKEHTYSELYEFIKESCQKDNTHMFKIYDKFRSQRIENTSQLNIILTTIHKVKGLEYDAALMTPSFSDLPFKHNSEKNTENIREKEFNLAIEEEKRLMYVAYTRAKKHLWVYTHEREKSLLENAHYSFDAEKKLGIRDSDGIDKLKINFTAEYGFKANGHIKNNIKKNDPLTLRVTKQYSNKNKEKYIDIKILHADIEIGQLSQSSKICKRINTRDFLNNAVQGKPYFLSGLFVNEVFVWTYEDSKKSDQTKNKNYADKWSPAAVKQGFIYLVDFTGFVNVQEFICNLNK